MSERVPQLLTILDASQQFGDRATLPLPLLEDLGEALLDFSKPADLMWLQAT